ncbi:MAG: tRNA (guanosine-2'-O-)-methyltransferase [Gammaproteobacteria bacterium]|jgi:tRNA (guanosine-2'-O-)-methyltransferase
MTPERFARLRSTLARRQPDLTLLLDNVRKAHNFSALLRTCDAVGIHEVHGVWPSAQPRPIGVTSSGAQKWLTVTTHETIERAVSQLKAHSLQVVAAHIGTQSIDYREINYTRPTAVVLGAELGGVGETALRCADAHVSIAMQGMVESLNLSVAAAVILFEAQRQRLVAGMYRQRRLPDAQYTRTLFEWAHPKVAQHCQRHGLAYPLLDASGGIDEKFDGKMSPK